MVGNKLKDPEFLKVIAHSDIVGLVELHADKELFLPGFKSVKQKIREKNFKGPKIAGGIGLFVRNEISHLVQVVPNKNNDSIWIKLKKEIIQETNDVYIGTYYGSPPKRKGDNTSDFFTCLNEEISMFKKKGVTLVQGDLNARTGNIIDFIAHDKFDPELGIENLNNQHTRNSQDRILNTRGKELLDVCKLNDFLILNGRKIGDLSGSFTSHQWNGSAVVDYFLSQNEFVKNISKLVIGKFIPWLSDHCPLHTTIFFNDVKNGDKHQEKNLVKTHPGFIWNEVAKCRYTDILKSKEVGDRIENLTQAENLKPIKIASEIKDILINNAKKCNLKRKKRKKNESTTAPWFNIECEDKKRSLRDAGRNLQQNPCDQNFREELNKEKRNFKKLIK